MLKLKTQIKLQLGIAFSLLLFYCPLMSQDAPGLSGFVHITGGVFNYRTNTVAKFLENKVSEKVTNSLYTLPDSESLGSPLGAIELKYTFKNKKSQLFFGSTIMDMIRFDFVQQLAVRKLLQNGEYMSVGMLLSTIPVALWEDPFIVDVDRVETDRNSLGVRMEWINIRQSNIGLRYDLRKIKLEEHSGSFLGLTNDEQKLLDRNGFSHRMTISYTKQISKSHALIPIVNLSYHATKGESKKGPGISVEISHAYRKNGIALVTNLSGGYRKYISENPIYKTRQSNTEFSIVESFFCSLNNNQNRSLLLTASVAYLQSKSNIDFFTQSGLLAQIGVMFRFSPKLGLEEENLIQKN